MIKLTGKKIEVDEQIFICDFCGREMNTDTDVQTALECSCAMDFNFGYFSARDGNMWKWELCHECADLAAKSLEQLKNERSTKFI